MLGRLTQISRTKTEKSHAEKAIRDNVVLIISQAEKQNIKPPKKMSSGNCPENITTKDYMLEVQV